MSLNSLLQKISSRHALKEAWDCLNKYNKDSKGLSGETIETFSKNLNDKLESISSQLISGKYKFSPNRAVAIRKSNKHDYRPLQIPEISDRVVIKSIAIELEQHFNNILENSKGFSFAYQKKIGIKDAILKIKEYYSIGYTYALKADIKNFFSEVNKSQLLHKEIFPRLSDKSLNNLIESALNMALGGLDILPDVQRSCFTNINKGIPQGNALSPLFSNIYLAPFDKKLIDQEFKLVRYADDFVILCKSKAECIKAYHECVKILKGLNLEIHNLSENGKTSIINIEENLLTFLSVTFDGNDIYPSQDNFDKLKNKLREICNSKQRNSPSTVFLLLKKIVNVHEGWISAFIYTNLEKYREELDFFIDRQLYLALRRFEWRLQHKTLQEVPKKYSLLDESRKCLSRQQRIYSGIALTQDLVNEKIRNAE